MLRNDASVVVLDVKGDLLRNYGKAMEKNGYQIKCLDVISSDFGKSHMYNPFVYVKTEVDMIRLVSNIQTYRVVHTRSDLSVRRPCIAVLHPASIEVSPVCLESKKKDP